MLSEKMFSAAIVIAFFSWVVCTPVIAESLSTPSCVHHGDVSLDGNITAGDAQMAFSIVLGTITPSYEEECAADCTADGMVTAGDAQAIFYAVLGIGACADPLVNDTPTPPQTPTPTPFAGCTGGDLVSIDPIVGNMRCAPAGIFNQGSPGDEPCRGSTETQFTHTLTRILVVMETEITRQMWVDLKAVQATLPDDPSDMTYSSTMSHPVQQSTWYESVLFANLLSLQNGYTQCYYTDAGFTTPIGSMNYTAGPFYCDFDADGYRLPSEGEWEFFTRAGTVGPFSFSEPNYTSDNCSSCTAGAHPVLEQYCWNCANAGDVGTQIAGNLLANPWNLKDVHGNVYEWCWDWFGTYPGTSTDYTGPASGSSRLIRGGSWNNYAQHCRSAQRLTTMPGFRSSYLGFRLVRSIPPVFISVGNTL